LLRPRSRSGMRQGDSRVTGMGNSAAGFVAGGGLGGSRPCTAGSEAGSIFADGHFPPWPSRPASRATDMFSASRGPSPSQGSDWQDLHSAPRGADGPAGRRGSSGGSPSSMAGPSRPEGILLADYRWHDPASRRPSTPDRPAVRTPQPRPAHSQLAALSPRHHGAPTAARFAQPTEASSFREAELARNRGDRPLAATILASTVAGAGRSATAEASLLASLAVTEASRPVSAAAASRPRGGVASRARSPPRASTPAVGAGALSYSAQSLPLQRYLATGARPVPKTARARGATELFPFANAEAVPVAWAAAQVDEGEAKAEGGRQLPRSSGGVPRAKRSWASAQQLPRVRGASAQRTRKVAIAGQRPATAVARARR